MSTCAKCIFKPFCHSAGYVCSSFKDKDRFADRNEVIREFADKLKAILNPFVSYDECRFYTVKVEDINNLVKEMTGEAEP